MIGIIITLITGILGSLFWAFFSDAVTSEIKAFFSKKKEKRERIAREKQLRLDEEAFKAHRLLHPVECRNCKFVVPFRSNPDNWGLAKCKHPNATSSFCDHERRYGDCSKLGMNFEEK